MNFFLRIDDLSFIKYISNYEKAENSSLRNWFESISLDYAWVCFNISSLSLTLVEIELKIFFAVYVGCMVRKVKSTFGTFLSIRSKVHINPYIF